MTKKGYKFLVLETGYWRPGIDYVQRIVDSVKGKLRDGDIVTVSEKAVSTASGNILDESSVHPSLLASFVAKYWMRWAWGYFLGVVCHMRRETVQRLRTYPVFEGGAHKQVALSHAGFFQTLMHGSEGGIDGSNLAFSFVSLPLKDSQQIANRIRERLKTKLGRDISVMILDTDKTYSLRNFHFTPRPRPIEGIRGFDGFVSYVVGRFLKLQRRATPVAFVGSQALSLGVEEALRVAELANRARGFGAGKNVWDMAEAFGVAVTDVTWDMLDHVAHKPIVLVRRF